MGTYGYVAPEYLATGIISAKTFGLLVHIQVAFTTSFKILTSILQSNPIYVWLLLLRILYRLPLWKEAHRLCFKIAPHKNLKDNNA